MEAGTELVLSEEPEKKSENSGHHSQFSPYGIGDFLSVSTDINDSHTLPSIPLSVNFTFNGFITALL